MHKVIVEEPRRGGGRNKKNRCASLPDELLPKHEGMRRPYQNRKWFGEHLGPLRRWLRSNVGRPWNDVYSEACEVIKPDNPVRAHIRTHMLECVERNTFIRDGKVWCRQIRWACVECPIDDLRSRWCLFYVHPETGILCEIPNRARPRRRAAQPTDTKWLSETVLLRNIDGCWFECRMAQFSDRLAKGESPWMYDLIHSALICRSKAWASYGQEVYCVSKRQLSKRELKKHRLRNGVASHKALQPRMNTDEHGLSKSTSDPCSSVSIRG